MSIFHAFLPFLDDQRSKNIREFRAPDFDLERNMTLTAKLCTVESGETFAKSC